MNRCIIGDCRESMRRMVAEGVRVQMCVTSPPYWGLRDYGHPGQLGLEPTPAEYVANMVDVFRLVRDLLADDGVLFLNLGDSYFGGGRGGGSEGSKQRTNVGALIKAPKWSSVNEPAPHAVPCGTSGKAPASSTARDCLCGSLCDACRKAYRIGKSRSDARRDPMPETLLSGSTRAHTESDSGRLPTSGLTDPAGRSEDAIPAAATVQDLEAGPLLVSQASTTAESYLPRQGAPHQSAPPSECQLCGCSFERCAQPSAGNSGCTCDTGSQSVPSVTGRTDTVSSGSAYLHLTTNTLKPKDLMGMPWRVAFALQADGWYLRQDIIWAKPNPMPESVTDRCTKSHEYLFLLSKRERYYYDAAAIAEPHGSNWLEKRKPYQIKGNGDRNDGGQPPQSANEQRNKRSVWTVATQPYSEAHFATFPPALIEPCILAGSRPGDVVLDPFFGSGTTGEVCERLGRRWIGCELSPEYGKLAAKRTAQQGMMFAQEAAP
jgi:site-specific DNA-methyltransferase (cytosine-N4-specific)